MPGEDLLMKDVWADGSAIMAQLTFREAIARGIAQEMRRDESVVFLGEDVGAAGGVFKANRRTHRGVRDRRAFATRRSRSRRSSAAAMGAA